MTEDANEPYVGEALTALGKRIRQTRLEKGLSVRDMVINHDYHDAQWRRYEKGASLTVPSLLRIAKSLGTSLSVLLDGIGEFAISQVDSFKDTSPRQEGRKAAVKKRSRQLESK